MNDIAELDPRLSIGANNPPADEPTPFDLSRKEIEDLYGEALLWLDGEPVTTQAQADGIGKLTNDIRSAIKLADERRVVEKQPFDDGAAEVQSRYNPLVKKPNDKGVGGGKAYLALDTCKKALAPFLRAEEAKKLAIAEAARLEARAKQEAAQAAFRAADATDLAGRQRAEELAAEAKQADRIATKAENDKAQARGGGRAIGMRSSYRAEITNERDFAAYVWTDHRFEMTAFLLTMAIKLIDRNIHKMPGVIVHHDRTPV